MGISIEGSTGAHARTGETRKMVLDQEVAGLAGVSPV